MMLTHNNSTNCNHQKENLFISPISANNNSGGGIVKPQHGDETSTISTQHATPAADISFHIRHVEESWHHLIKLDDSKKLKEIAVCNFDFLLAAVSYFFCSCLIRVVEEDEILLNVVLSHNFFFVAYRRCCATQVQTVSISYLRCLMEHVRSYILDRDIELVYYTIRKSSDVLTRDPMQLGAQVCVEIGLNRIASLSAGEKGKRKAEMAFGHLWVSI